MAFHLPAELRLAREMRVSGKIEPARLWYAAEEDVDAYRHAMYEAGAFATKEGKLIDVCPICGWSPDASFPAGKEPV